MNKQSKTQILDDISMNKILKQLNTQPIKWVPPFENLPRPGFCSPVNIVRIIDGDTLEVELTREFNVRLTHENDEGKYFNTPERNTAKGERAKKIVEALIKDDPKITLFVPTGENNKLMDITSFNRILGEIWIDDKKLTDILLEQGYGELK